jgi:hypothetical protein
MRVLLAAVLSASMAVSAPAADRPLIALLDPPAIAARCDEGLAKARAMIATMEKAGGDGFFAEWNALQVAIEDTRNPISVLGSLSRTRRCATRPSRAFASTRRCGRRSSRTSASSGG